MMPQPTAVATAETVDSAFRERLAAAPDARFVKCGPDWLTFAQLDERTDPFRLAVWVPLGEAEQRQFEERFGTPVMSEGYGQTECVPVTVSAPHAIRTRDTSGLVSPLLEVAIVDDADNQLPFGAEGEIVVRPMVPNAMYSGYRRKPEATVTAWSNLWHQRPARTVRR
jgi:acyl-coenzyme A synthetase/AMP-(fatty) acid ligase